MKRLLPLLPLVLLAGCKSMEVNCDKAAKVRAAAALAVAAVDRICPM